MTAQRSDITKALDEIIGHEEGILFQRLATLVAKQKWPDLIASEPKKDLGADARASGALAANGQGKILACSLTAELAKIRHDATEVKLRYPDTRVFIFATPRGVSNQKQEEWKKDIRTSFEFDLVVMSREEIVSSLMEPQNAVICRALLKLPVEIEPDLSDLIAKIARATSAVTLEWFTQKRLADQPLIDLQAFRLGEGARPGASFASTKILDELLQGRRIVIEAPAGRGKTTTLIHFAKRIGESGGHAFVIDLPEWAKSGRNLLEYIADMPAFVANGVDAKALARASSVERFVLLFNGWNELSATASGNIERELSKADREFPTAGIVVATRSHSIRPPFAGPMRLTLPPLTRTERTGYLTAALGDSAQELTTKLEASQALDELTRTPLILREVTRIFKAGRALPTTKVGILESVIQLIEEEVEHRNELRRAPLNGNATAYLAELAVRLTTLGDVTISEPEARRVCTSASNKLQSEMQLADAPHPGDVLDALCRHHILERIDYPEVAFRFEHQQFQEFYAALFLDRVLASVPDGTTAEGAEFTNNYLNVVSWDEPLRMIAEKIGSDSIETETKRTVLNRGKRLIELALQIDPIFAADLARLAGNAVWQEVASMLGQRIHAWHHVEDPNHKQCALAAMFASGSADFSDVIISLLTSENDQVRLAAYRVWPELHLSTFGANWQTIVGGWKEEARIDLVSEVTINQRRRDVAEYFLFNDPSIEVRIKAIEALSWIGARNQVKRGLENLPPATLGSALLRLHREDIPPSLLPQTIAAYQDQLASITDPIQRIRLFLALLELGQTDIVEALKTELIRLPTGTTGPNVRESLEIIRKIDKRWASEWVAARITTDSFWHESWIDFVTSIPETLRDELFQKISNENLNFGDRKIIAILSAVADAVMAGEVFSRLCVLRREIDASGPTIDQMRATIFRQLEDLFRSIPSATTVLAVSRAISEEFDSVKLRVITELFNRVGREESDLRSELPEDLRQGLRRYLKMGVQFAASQDDVNGQLLANLASALARVGDGEDMPDLAALIQADLKRLRHIREAITKGGRFHGIMGWSMWHLQAVVSLDREQAETVLLPLLSEDEGYDVEAAKFLLKLATVDEHRNTIFPARTDYGLIWKARSGETPTEFIEDRRRRFSTAIKAHVSDLFVKSSASFESGQYAYKLSELAVVLATLDGKSSSALVLQVIALPGRWNSWRRVDAVRALIFSGLVAPAETVLNTLNLVIEEVCKGGIYVNDQDSGLLKSALCLLPFVDNPAAGISRIREVLAKIRIPPHELADIISALGYSRSPAALALLRELAESDPIRIEQSLRAWINALANLNLPESHEILLSFLNPQENTFPDKLRIDNDDGRLLASRIVNIADADSLAKQCILELLSQPLSAERRSLLLRVIAGLGTPDVILAALPHMTDSSNQQPIPYELWKAFENLFLEHRPYDPATNTFTVVSRPSNEIRARLFNLVLNDPLRRRSAFAMLGQIEVWHLENGKPDSEPRHPALEFGVPWPPLELFQSDTASP